MATNLGFMPVRKGKRYFISYKNDDTLRVGKITKKLNEMGVPMWYDYGIEKGEEWSREITRNIHKCTALIVFATKTLFAKEDTYVRTEFRLADIYHKKIFVVWLDDVTPDVVSDELMEWYADVDDLQGIKISDMSFIPVEQIAWSMVTEFKLIHGRIPQPPSPELNIEVTNIDSSNHGIPSRSSFKRTIILTAIVLAIALVSAGIAVSAGVCDILPFIQKEDTESHTSYFPNNLSVGDNLTFGSYIQQSDSQAQPIEWLVLDVKDGKALIISKKLLDCVDYYNYSTTDVKWETSTLRKWMNDDFLNEAFSRTEQDNIATITNHNRRNADFGTEGGNDTEDKVFALSIDEATKYFDNNDERKAYATSYAVSCGCSFDSFEQPTARWWLRSPGFIYSDAAACVDYDGTVDSMGAKSMGDNVAVRPAMWIIL